MSDTTGLTAISTHRTRGSAYLSRSATEASWTLPTTGAHCCANATLQNIFALTVAADIGSIL